MRAQGFESLDDWMSMAGPRYMQALEDRLVELTRQGVGFYKLDGLFGHLNRRDFELHGEKYGLPSLPQLGVQDFTAGDARLNDPRYDELKIYYLTAGTERLMQIFQKLGRVDPDIYIVISNGAYLSPWWLMYVDSVWMINAGDAAKGASRTAELVYRDGRYHDIWQEQHTQFPMCSVFNHEPKKTAADESADTFRQYLFMSLSRGTGLLELYLKPSVLQPADWDVLSEGLRWANERFPAFARVRMHEAVSAQMLSHIDFLAPVAQSSLSEHTVYQPDDAKHPIEPYIVMVADAYDAMTSTRSYRQALPFDVAIAELREKAGSQFHPECTAALIRALAREGHVAAPEDATIDDHWAITPPEVGVGSAGLGDLISDGADTNADAERSEHSR